LFQSIRWRLAASYALLILLSVTLMGSLAIYIVQRYVQQKEGEYLKANAQAVAEQAARFLDPQVRRIALENLASASAFLGDARVRIMAGDGTVLADSGDPGLPDEFLWLIPSALAEIYPERGASPPLIIPMPSRDPGRRMRPRDLMPLLRDLPLGTSHLYARRMLTPWGRRFLFEGDTDSLNGHAGPDGPPREIVSISVPVTSPGGSLGTVEISSPLNLSGEVLGPMRGAVLFSGLGALAIAVAAGLFIGRTITNPLQSLAGTARSMADGDLSARARTNGRDEIGQLAVQFNAMAESLERSFHDLRSERDSLKRFVADASHELRTPITALATFNELLQGSAAEDRPAREEFLRESQKQLKRLQWITANLLDLSRLDGGIASLSVGLHDAADVVEAAVSGFRARAGEKGVSLEIEPLAAPFKLACDRERLVMALSNVVDNAVKFVQEGGEVRVAVRAQSGQAVFSVSDNGPGIPAEEIPLIFGRFYRGKGTSSPGAGLGLAIAISIARAHGGSLSVKSTPGSGSLFTLSVPLAATKSA
jgi:signal transduction histidine kinase